MDMVNVLNKKGSPGCSFSWLALSSRIIKKISNAASGYSRMGFKKLAIAMVISYQPLVLNVN